MTVLGCIFDLREFTIHDGPGVRVTVFMKGCPLRCLWCHNPEGLDFQPQKNIKTQKMCGQYYTVEDLVQKLKQYQPFFETSGGGITFSGGEPSAQAEFILECCRLLPSIHKVLDTSGFCPPEIFCQLLSVIDLVYYDLKLLDPQEHKKYTGQNNQWILQNLQHIIETNINYHLRIPLIPNISDTQKNLNDLVLQIEQLKRPPQSIDFLPYNHLAGGKYEYYQKHYPLAQWFYRNNAKTIDNVYHVLESKGYNVNLY